MSRTIVITGSSDGIGAAAARELHRAGHRIVIVGRSSKKTEAVARELSVEHFIADFTRLDEVAKLAADLDRICPQIDVLANNAGGIFGDRTKTVDGFEMTFQINHLSPFLLTRLLMPKLIAGSAAVIQTSSVGARLVGRLDIDDVQHERDFRPTLAYGTAKLDNILFTRELHRRYHPRGVSAAAFHPGNVASNFALESDSALKYVVRLGRIFLLSPEKGARQLVWLAQSTPGVDWASGTYYERGQPARRQNPQALDDDLARQLWEHSEAMLAGAGHPVPSSD